MNISNFSRQIFNILTVGLIIRAFLRIARYHLNNDPFLLPFDWGVCRPDRNLVYDSPHHNSKSALETVLSGFTFRISEIKHQQI